MNPPLPFHVLYEDNHLLAVAKPAGLATMGTPEGQPTLLALAKEYVKQRYQKPGNVYLGVVSRLDAPVTGVVLLARTSKAAARLTEQFRSRGVEKTYWALAEGVVEPVERPAGQLAGRGRTPSADAHRRPDDARGERSTADVPPALDRQRPFVAGGGTGDGPQAPDSATASPVMGIRSSAIESTAASWRFHTASHCTRGDW